MDNSTDWGGFGIINSKKLIVTTIDEFRSELCTLLQIGKEEPSHEGTQLPSTIGPEESSDRYLQLSKSLALSDQWEALRSSGWAAQRSERTIKLWADEFLKE